jgi:MYXO-CTERM domain-containing protein
MTATSTSTGGTTSTTTGAGAGGSAGETPSSESGCGACVVARGSANGAPWIGLGLLLVLRRRRQSARVGARA